jgi:hypothetical protein
MVISYEVFGLCGRNLHSTGGKYFLGLPSDLVKARHLSTPSPLSPVKG